jgi:hypothetical protein
MAFLTDDQCAGLTVYLRSLGKETLSNMAGDIEFFARLAQGIDAPNADRKADAKKTQYAGWPLPACIDGIIASINALKKSDKQGLWVDCQGFHKISHEKITCPSKTGSSEH